MERCPSRCWLAGYVRNLGWERGEGIIWYDWSFKEDREVFRVLVGERSSKQVGRCGQPPSEPKEAGPHSVLPVSVSEPAFKAEPPNGRPGAGKGCDSPKQTQVMSGSRARGAPWECCLAPKPGMGLSCRVLFPSLFNLPLPHPTSCSLWPPCKGPSFPAQLLP